MKVFLITARAAREEVVERLVLVRPEIVVCPEPFWRYGGVAGGTVRDVDEEFDVSLVPARGYRKALNIEPCATLGVETDVTKPLRE